ncbi:MAG TPA: Fe2+-dependent dioxygenase [Immundisolibacter sp.]
MLLTIPQVLDRETLLECRRLVTDADWVDGRGTAGTQSSQVKNNRQLPEDAPAATQARALVLRALSAHALFFAAALPKRIYPPLFNRYEGAANAFGSHIDNAIRTHPATARHVRSDLSATLFLSDPDSYDGGELVIEGSFGSQPVKLAAGDLVLYPASSVHRVEPVTRGLRLACFMWIESMVRETERRRLLYELDMAILALRTDTGDSPAVVRLTGCYHNLLRMWAEV